VKLITLITVDRLKKFYMTVASSQKKLSEMRHYNFYVKKMR